MNTMLNYLPMTLAVLLLISFAIGYIKGFRFSVLHIVAMTIQLIGAAIVLNTHWTGIAPFLIGCIVFLVGQLIKNHLNSKNVPLVAQPGGSNE